MLDRKHLTDLHCLDNSQEFRWHLTLHVLSQSNAWPKKACWILDITAASEAKGYIGERYDADAGLQYLNARYYDPDLGMFTQPDWFEVTEPGVGTNRYSYSFNDPVNLSDPSGNDILQNTLKNGWELLQTVGNRLRDPELYSRSNFENALKHSVPGAHASNRMVEAVTKGDGKAAALAATEMLAEVSITVVGAGSTKKAVDAGVSSAARFSAQRRTDRLNEGRNVLARMLNDPKLFSGKSADEVAAIFRSAGYNASVKQGSKGSRRQMLVDIGGHRTISQVKIHPGGGVHSGAYTQISTSDRGKILVYDGRTYIMREGQKFGELYDVAR